MKNLIYSVFIFITLLSCSKSDINIDTKSQLLGKWKLNVPSDVIDLKKKTFNFGKSELGITGMRLDGKWGNLISRWDEKAEIKYDYYLSDDNKILNIKYEDDQLLRYDIIELNKNKLIIKLRINKPFDPIDFSKIK